MPKKLIALLLIGVLVFSFTACGADKPEETTPAQLKEIKNIILIIGDGFGL